jgi:hypothetical protein
VQHFWGGYRCCMVLHTWYMLVRVFSKLMD